jgi:AcrR family transcriptional regulator
LKATTSRAIRARTPSAAAAQSTAARRTSYHHGDLPRALRLAAKRLLAEGGSDALTLRRVAQLAGVNHRAVYRHFEDKRELLATLAEEGFRELSAKIRTALTRTSAQATDDRLLAIAVCYLRFAQEHTAIFRIMFGPRLNEDERFPWLETAVAEPLAIVVAEMERGAAGGPLKPGHARERALALWALAHGYADLVLQKRIRVRTAAVARRYLGEVFAELLRGLLA